MRAFRPRRRIDDGRHSLGMRRVLSLHSDAVELVRGKRHRDSGENRETITDRVIRAHRVCESTMRDSRASSLGAEQSKRVSSHAVLDLRRTV
jgi:hypothetical protein